MEQKQTIEIFLVHTLEELKIKLDNIIKEGKKEIKEIVIDKRHSATKGDLIEVMVVFEPAKKVKGNVIYG